MRIAIVNLLDYDKLQDTIKAIEAIYENVIDAQVDLFIAKNVVSHFEGKEYKFNINPLQVNEVKVSDLKIKLDNLLYYSKSKYDIAIDTHGSLKTAFITYLLAGRTAGYKLSGIKGYIFSLFYDEKIKISDLTTKEDMVKRVLSKPFGF